MTCQIANVFKREGVKKGDRVALYMPASPHLAASMLACARIGAIHRFVCVCTCACVCVRIRTGIVGERVQIPEESQDSREG